MARLAVNWWWLVALSCSSLAACRAHEALCGGVECEESPQSGEGGAPHSVPESMAGDAGDAGAPACESDQRCQNGSSCDGEERCTADGCEPGTPLPCEHGTKCDDAAPELCVYPEPSPWLLALSNGGLVALPTAQLGSAQAFTLAPSPTENLYEGFSRIFWSPDGKVAIIRADGEEWGRSFHYARFGAGLPSAVAPLPDVPNFIEGEEDPRFSADSEQVFIYGSNSGAFLLNLRDPNVPTRYFPRVDHREIDTSFCADPHTWLVWASHDSYGGGLTDLLWITRLNGDELEEQSIGELDSFGVSSDRRLLVFGYGYDDEGNWRGNVLRPCSTDAWSVEFPEARYIDFSPDSKLLWLDDDRGTQRVLSLEEPSTPVELLSSDDLAATLTGQFTPDSKHLLAHVEGVPYLVDLKQASSDPLLPLGLPETSEIAVLRNAALLAWPDREAVPNQLVWQAVPPRGAPIALLDDVTWNNSTFVDDNVNPGRVFLVRVVRDKSELFSIWLDGSAPEAKLLLTIDGGFKGLQATPDQSAIVFLRDTNAFGATLVFAPFEPSGALGKPWPVDNTGYFFELQPWP